MSIVGFIYIVVNIGIEIHEIIDAPNESAGLKAWRIHTINRFLFGLAMEFQVSFLNNDRDCGSYRQNLVSFGTLGM